MRIGHLSDIHMTFVEDRPKKVERFFDEVRRAKTDALVITGDIAEGASWAKWLIRLRDEIGVPVYFVLGNHDFWGSSFSETRALARELTCAAPDSPKWLPAIGIARLTEKTSLVGQDGWYDCAGDLGRVNVIMNDWYHIADFGWAQRPDVDRVVALSRRLAEDASLYLQIVIEKVFNDGAEEVICATHVPPFREASLYRGRPNSPNVPLFSASVIGEKLRRVMEKYPDRRLTVLCGHTHDRCRYQAAENLHVQVAAADYGAPALGDVLEVR